MTEASMPVEIFCCYSRADEAWLRKLEIHLSLLQRQGLISLWYDRQILAGQDWAHTIDTHLETASVILLLVSADFLASDYCYGVEMKRALARQAAGEARILPLLLRSVDWKDAPFAHLQVLPADARPLASWPDADMALADITAGIRRVIEDVPQLTASAPHTVFPQIWNIPYPRNPFFLGRDAELALVHQHLQKGAAMALSQPQAISGLGGIGKTQLALEYAYRYRSGYQAVLWARAESREALVSSYIALASLLQLPECKAREQDIIVQAVKAWLQVKRFWLLILDNADELALLPDFLPASMGGHLLLTTRAAAAGRLANLLTIETLEPVPGALFLLRRAALLGPSEILAQAPQELQELALQISQELGGLPLALDQAGAYLEETGMSLSLYWQIYQQHRADLLGQRGGLVADHPAPVATTWSLSFERVQEKNKVSADLLCLCAFLSPDAIPEEILTTGASFLGPSLAPVAADAFLLNQAIEALRSYSLIRRDPKGKTFSVHRLVQTVLRDALAEAERNAWAVRALHSVNATFPDSEPGNWSQCERMLSQVLATTQFIDQQEIRSLEAGRLLHKAASYLCDRARYPEAEALYQRALAIREHELGTSHPEVASSLNGLADLFNECGKYAEAEPLYQRALAIREQQLGTSHPEVASSLEGLADLYIDQGKYAEAEPLHQRALAIREHELGASHPEVASSLNGLAFLYSVQGKDAKAEVLYQRALLICEHEIGAPHLEVVSSLEGLASLYRAQDKYAEAEPLYQRALAIREQQQGTSHPNVAYPLEGLASLYREQGKYAEAKPLYQRAIAIWEQQLGPPHPEVAYPLTGLAELYREQGKYAEAEPLYQRAIATWKEQLGASHLYLTYPLTGLASLYREQGKYAEAETFYQRALVIREQQLSVSPHLAFVTYPLEDLAGLYREQGRYAEAEALYQRALTIREQTLGQEHPATAEILYDLAQLREAQGNSEEARALYARALAVREPSLGAHHPQTTETRKRLIALLHTMGQHEEAAQFEATQSEP